MKVIENKCHICYGHLALDLENHVLYCEDCSYSEKVKGQATWQRLLNMAVEFGPKERRQKLTPAGEMCMASYRSGDPVDHPDAWQAYRAAKGLIEEEEELARLREAGFIL